MAAETRQINKRLLFAEPFYGGSHKAFADNFIAHCPWSVDLYTLPARFWKWRMRGAALALAEQIADIGSYDLLFSCGLLSLSDLKMMLGPDCPPAVLYMHENQLSYPLKPGEAMDYQFGFTDITSCLAADRIIFNSRFHADAFLQELPGFLGRMPDCLPKNVVPAIEGKIEVIYPGYSMHAELPSDSPMKPEGAPVIIWNHRWEHDKNPGAFFRALEKAAAEGLDFRLVLLGERYFRIPAEFRQGLKAFEKQIIHCGYAADRREYEAFLADGDIVISTAFQENYGISIVEAAVAGCRPLLPHRLSYPEIVPDEFHSRVLYEDEGDLVAKLIQLLRQPERIFLPALTESFREHRIERLMQRYLAVFERVLGD